MGYVLIKPDGSYVTYSMGQGHGGVRHDFRSVTDLNQATVFIAPVQSVKRLMKTPIKCQPIDAEEIRTVKLLIGTLGNSCTP